MVTNPVTWRPRYAARGPRVVPLPSGVLIHTGLPNPGVNQVIKTYRARWAHCLAPVIVHVATTTPDDVARAVNALDRCEGIAGIELGLHDQATSVDIAMVLQAVTSNTQLPLLVLVPLYNAVDAARAAEEHGAGGLVVAGPPRGTTRDPESGQLIGGRVYGPWLKAQALRAVGQVARIATIPVIGCGGIHTPDDARDFLDAGAVAVQVDTVTWARPRMIEVIARNLGGLEITRATGALADEWEPGIGNTMLIARGQQPTPPSHDGETPAVPPPLPPELPE
jgi:dihydroorotate dehydrogenase (NAD+) catalytic subunit